MVTTTALKMETVDGETVVAVYSTSRLAPLGGYCRSFGPETSPNVRERFAAAVRYAETIDPIFAKYSLPETVVADMFCKNIYTTADVLRNYREARERGWV